MAIIEVTRREANYFKRRRHNMECLKKADEAAKAKFKAIPYYMQEAKRNDSEQC